MTTQSVQNPTAISDAIIGYLQERFPMLGTVDQETTLLGNAAIDSLGFLEIVTFLEERFGTTLDDDDFDPDNLQTPANLAALVVRKLS